MRTLLIVVYSLSNGGAERVAANLANDWSVQGHDVHIATLGDDTRDDYPVSGKVSRHSLFEPNLSVRFWHRLTRHLNRLIQLRRLISTVQPDHVVGEMTYANLLCILAATGHRAHVSAVEQVHPPFVEEKAGWLLLRRLLYGRADTVIALTQRSALWLTEHTSTRHARVIPNGLNWPLPLGEPVVMPHSLLPDGAHVLLGVGRLETHKGFDILLNTFARLCREFPEWYLVLAGEGAERDRLNRQISEHNLQSRVLLTGRVGNVSNWYQCATLYVMSSRYEGFPGALLEAMASGCAVLSVDCETGPAEIIEHGVNGWLVENSPRALEIGLRRLMADAGLRTQLADKATGVIRDHGQDHVLQLWESHFLDLESQSGRSRETRQK